VRAVRVKQPSTRPVLTISFENRNIKKKLYIYIEYTNWIRVYYVYTRPIPRARKDDQFSLFTYTTLGVIGFGAFFFWFSSDHALAPVSRLCVFISIISTYSDEYYMSMTRFTPFAGPIFIIVSTRSQASSSLLLLLLLLLWWVF